MLPTRKATTVEKACENVLNQDNRTIGEVACVIGLIVSSFSGVQFGELHYRYLKHNKIEVLQADKGDYDAFMTLSQEAQADLNCWVHNVTLAFRNILPTDPDLTLTIDALTQAWGEGSTGRLTTGCICQCHERIY